MSSPSPRFSTFLTPYSILASNAQRATLGAAYTYPYYLGSVIPKGQVLQPFRALDGLPTERNFYAIV